MFVREFLLQVLEGPDAGLSHAATSERVSIGTHRSSDLALSDPTVSHFHCEVRLAQGNPFIHDLDSRNGTLVDDVPVLSAPLRENCLVQLGRSRLQFRLGKKEMAILLSERDRFGRLVGRSPSMR